MTHNVRSEETHDRSREPLRLRSHLRPIAQPYSSKKMRPVALDQALAPAVFPNCLGYVAHDNLPSTLGISILYLETEFSEYIVNSVEMRPSFLEVW